MPGDAQRVGGIGRFHEVEPGHQSAGFRELVAGFWLWQVRSLEEAVQWPKRAPFNADSVSPMEVEIRPFYGKEDFGEAFTPELRAQEQRMRAYIDSNE